MQPDGSAPAIPAAPARTPKRVRRPQKSKAKPIIIGLLVTASALAVMFFVVTPWLIRSRIEDVADKRGLSISTSGVTLGVSEVGVLDVVVHPKGSERAIARASRIDASLYLLRPQKITVPQIAIDVRGSIDEIDAALAPVLKADAALPAGEHLPFTIVKGTMQWKEPLGVATKLKVDQLGMQTDPRVGSQTITFAKATLSAFPLRLPDMSGKIARVRGQDTVDVNLAPPSGGNAKGYLRRDGDGGELSLALDKLPLEPLRDDDGLFPIDMSASTISGDARYSWTSEGKLSADFDVEAHKLKLPAFTIGGLKLTISGDGSMRFVGKAKKGSPWVLSIEDGQLKASALGSTRTVRFTGELSMGEGGNGPRKLSLDWSVDAIACSDVASVLGGATAGKAVSGNVTIKGTLKGDPLRPGSLKHTATVDKTCAVDVAGALGTLSGLGIPGIP